MEEHVLAIDIGGTNIKAGLVDREGNATHMLHRPSRAAEGREALLSVLKEVVEQQCAAGNVICVGAGSPGTISHRTGMVTYMQAHIPGYSGTPLAKRLSEWSGVEATIDNDVNIIALGENWKGAGKGSRCQISLALGTGLGGGVVVDGKLFRGARERAPEFGHMIVNPGGEPCTCGNFGCVEVYTAPGAMARRAQRYLGTGVPSALANSEKVTAAEIVRYGNRGDHLCRKLLDEAARYLALLVWNLAQAFDPDVFVMGGGLMKAGGEFLGHLHRELEAYYCAPELEPMYTIKISELGDNAGVIGAAKLAWDWLDGIDRS